MVQDEAIIKASRHDTGRFYKLVQETGKSALFIAYDRRADFWEYINLSKYVEAKDIYHDPYNGWQVAGHDIPYADL